MEVRREGGGETRGGEDRDDVGWLVMGDEQNQNQIFLMAGGVQAAFVA